MPGSWTLTPPYFLAFAFLCGVVGFRMGWRTGNRIALPLIQAFLGWGAFLLAWTFRGPAWAAACVGAWAVGTTVVSVYVFLGRPQEADARVIRAKEYRERMLAWLATGRGPESAPLATAIEHGRELIWYLAAAIVSANLLSIAMGAILLNYMNAYVATLLRAATNFRRVLLLAWNLWSIVRVASYILIGAGAASPVLALWGFRVDRQAATQLAIAGGIGVVLDLALKLAMSRACGKALAAAVDLEAAKANRGREEMLRLGLRDP